LVMENRTLSMPASVDSIPGKSNAEDHVSNSTWAARKALMVTHNVRQIIACELLMAAQALTLVEDRTKDAPLGKGTAKVLETIRADIPAALDGDRWYATEMAQADAMLQRGNIMAALQPMIDLKR
jgi:histidine ammonia-lyase